MHRREFIFSLAALAGAPVMARAKSQDSLVGIQLAATWQTENGYRAGVLSKPASNPGVMNIASFVDLPTRGHGLLLEHSGTLLTVARRPGNWLLRWDRNGHALAWHWIEPNRAYAGHVLASMDGRTLYTTEIDLETGAGLVGVRDAASLEKQAEWPTHGIDPHQLLWDASSPGNLIVANGGVPTLPETGRIKRKLDQMDSSLVRLDSKSGELLGQWRLSDRRLSLRHLAWNASVPNQPVLGVALQAEHDTPEEKANAPVLALFDGRSLRTAFAPMSLAGYGGDITALGSHFAVSCPRAQGVVMFDMNGGWQRFAPLSESCPLASDAHHIFAGGHSLLQSLKSTDATPVDEMDIPAIRLDNHWIFL